MFQGLLSIVKSKEGKLLVALAGGTILVMTGINLYHQIRVAKLKAEQLEKED